MSFLKEPAGPLSDEKSFPFFMMAVNRRLEPEGMTLSCAHLGGKGVCDRKGRVV
jgi:hypothetical protein